MTVSENSLDIGIIHISDIDQASFIGIIILLLIFIASAMLAYNHILNAERESIISSLETKNFFSMIPFIGETNFYTKFYKYSSINVSIKYVIRAIQLILIILPFAPIPRFILDKIADIIKKTTYAELMSYNNGDIFRLILILEIAVLVCMLVPNIRMTKAIRRTRLLGIFVDICPTLGYMILLTLINIKGTYFKESIIEVDD